MSLTWEAFLPSSSTPGRLYTCGRGSDGQLGQADAVHPAQNCALPHPVRLPGGPEHALVVDVAVGGGQQGCTACVTASGRLYTWGNSYKLRTGHGTADNIPMTPVGPVARPHNDPAGRLRVGTHALPHPRRRGLQLGQQSRRVPGAPGVGGRRRRTWRGA